MECMTLQEYEDLGGRFLPFISSCMMLNCTINKANICYAEKAGFNRLDDVKATNLPPEKEFEHIKRDRKGKLSYLRQPLDLKTKILKGDNVLSDDAY